VEEIRAWLVAVRKRSGMRKVIIAVARRLAIILHRLWVDGSEFRWTAKA
jgi:transposase